MADDAPKINLDDEARELQLERFKEEARAGIVDAKEKVRKANTPSGTSKLREGAVTIGEGAGVSIASVVAGEALAAASVAIAKQVRDSVGTNSPGKGPSVLIVDDISVANADSVYLDVKFRLDSYGTLLQGALDALIGLTPADLAPADSSTPRGQRTRRDAALRQQRQVAGALTAAVGAGQLIGDVIGLFRSDYSITSVEAAVQRSALVAESAHQLKKLGFNVLLPSLALLNDSAVIASFVAALEKASEIERRALVLESTTLQPAAAEIEDVETQIEFVAESLAKALAAEDQSGASRLRREMKDLSEDLRRLRRESGFVATKATVGAARSVKSGFETYASEIGKPGEGGKPSILVSAALREFIRSPANPRPLYLLHLDVGASGADVVTRTGVLSLGGAAAFLGAVQVSFLLAESSGSLQAAGMITEFKRQYHDFGGDFPAGTFKIGAAEKAVSVAVPIVIALALMVIAAAAVLALLWRFEGAGSG